MNKICEICIIGLLMLLKSSSYSQQADKKLFFAIDGLAPAIKIGLEKNISDRFSLKTSVGFCIVGPSLISYNIYWSYKLTKPVKPLGYNINFGFLDNYIDVITPVFSLGLGGGAGIYYRFRNSSILTFRIGAITGPSIDNHEFSMLTIPNFGIEYAFLFYTSRSRNKE